MEREEAGSNPAIFNCLYNFFAHQKIKNNLFFVQKVFFISFSYEKVANQYFLCKLVMNNYLIFFYKYSQIHANTNASCAKINFLKMSLLFLVKRVYHKVYIFHFQIFDTN